MATKDKSKFGVIEGTFVYAKVGQPDLKYQSTEKEWSIGVVVDEDTADGWDEQFAKQPAKKVKASEFEGKYRIPCPIADVKNVYIINLKRAATNNGVPVDEISRPKVYLDDAEGGRSEIGQSRLIGNGSFGKVSYYISSNDYGTFSRLQNVLMDEDGFKEYQSTNAGAGSEFGAVKAVKVEAARDEVLNSRPAKKVVEQDDEEEEDEKPVKPVKKPAKKTVAVDDFDDDSSPF
jgi:hypothetical protein